MTSLALVIWFIPIILQRLLFPISILVIEAIQKKEDYLELVFPQGLLIIG